MARVNVKYKKVDNAKGERVATNGYYTGEHMGTQMQDAKATDWNTDVHSVENSTIRYNQITQDVGDTQFPEREV